MVVYLSLYHRHSAFIKISIAIVCALFWAMPYAYAQSATATLSGLVEDQNGSVIPNVNVVVTNSATQIKREITTNSDGIFSFPLLQPGKYKVDARREGFASLTLESIVLEVGDQRTLRMEMKVGSVGDSINVTSTSTARGEDASIGVTVNQFQITELPSLTRNPYDFIAVSAGATPTAGSRGVGLAVNGQRSESGSFLLDGSDNNDPQNTGPGQTVPLEAVQEYRVLANNFTAEYGRNLGFVANVVTRSGTNEFHGAAYDFIRNSALAANTFQNNANGLLKQFFNRHQLGGALGGPIRKNKTFIFGSFESILVRSSAPVSGFVPTTQLLAISSPASQAIFSKFPLPSNVSTAAFRDGRVCPFGVTCNASTGEGFINIPIYSLATRVGPTDAGAGPPQDTYLATVRIDHNINEKTTLSGRYANQDVNQFPTIQRLYSSDLDRPSFTNNKNLTLNLTRTWSDTLITESRIVYNYVSTFNPRVPEEGFPSFAISVDRVLLPGGLAGNGGPQNIYQFYQSANLIKQKHQFKIGGQFIQTRDNRENGADLVTAIFTNTQGFINGNIALYQIALDTGGSLPGQFVNPPFRSPNFKRHFRYNDLAFFFQDTWKIASRLTISPGLRWEYFGQATSPGDEKQLDANFYFGDGSNYFEQIANGRFLRVIDAPEKYKGRFYRPDYNNFGPRFGLAYDLLGNGRTVFRAGIGTFYERAYGGAVFLSGRNPPTFGLIQLPNVPMTPALLNDPFTVFPNGPVRLANSAVNSIDQDLKTAYIVSWNTTLEREILPNLVFSGSYIGSNGNHLYTLNDINRPGSGIVVGRPNTRLVQNASGITALDDLGHSTYHGLQLKVDSRYIDRLGLQVGANYTWSHSIDNLSSTAYEDQFIGGGTGFLNAYNPGLDKGSSGFDARHRLVANFIWQAPIARMSTGFKKHLLNGWQISGLLSFQTGLPFSLADISTPNQFGNTRPRLTGSLPEILSPSEYVPDSRVPNSFLILPVNPVRSGSNCIPNITPFACQISGNGPFEGTLGRGVFRRPGTQSHDIAFMKNIDLSRISEGLKVQYRAEFYNIFNHSNLYINTGSLDVGATTFTSSTGSTPGVTASYGTPRNRPQEARQIVMALKITF
jgi:carboxypeptidase family protein/TonB-dependent receptor-like protein